MNTHAIYVRKVVGLFAVLFLSQCTITKSIDRADSEQWNDNGIWKQKAGSRTDYVPVEYAGAVSDDPATGQWMVDPQDGLRFYIPAKGTKTYTAEILRAEAYKATNRYTVGNQWAANAREVTLFPVHLATGFAFNQKARDKAANGSVENERQRNNPSSTDDSWMDTTTHDHHHHHKDKCKDDDRKGKDDDDECKKRD